MIIKLEKREKCVLKNPYLGKHLILVKDKVKNPLAGKDNLASSKGSKSDENNRKKILHLN